MDHQEAVELEQQGKLLIGVERDMAHKFYTDVPLSTILEATGEAPYVEKAVVRFAQFFGPVALLASIVLGFYAFHWWGIVCLNACPVAYGVYSAFSAMGRSRLGGITVLLFASVGIHFFGGFDVPWVTGFAIALVFSLWCTRLLYCSATNFLRAFVIRNERAFHYLSDRLVLRETSEGILDGHTAN